VEQQSYRPVTSGMGITRVGVVGSGIMGAGIAETAARAGFDVVIRSRRRDTADATLARLERSVVKQVERGKLTEAEASDVLARVSATNDLNDLAGCDLVIESVVEDLKTKTHLFRELDGVLGASAVMATNTSTLPVVELAMQTAHPESVCGIHFFNPAQSMTLVEIVRPLTANDATIEAACEFAIACGKEPIVVKDQAGFIVNHLLFPYLNNAVRLLEQGVASSEDIDAAMRGGCNFPIGPFAVLDLVGLDTSVAILDALYDEFRDPHYAAVPLLRRMVTAGLLGRKSGRGFYDYRKK
jgi:3-hydroxybutyryl-CoA dehydrogenase